MPEVKWMQQSFGVMAHWTIRTMPRTGEPTADWNARVDAFDVDQLVDTLCEMGASWLVFTCGHCGDGFCSPNAAMDDYFPGHCSERDLILELAKALHARGLHLIVYFQTEIDHESQAMRDALGWDLHPSDKSVFMDRWIKVLRTYALQWGEYVDGWWFDSCYDSDAKTFLRTCGSGWDNSRFDHDTWFNAARVGNPNAIISMNSGVQHEKHIPVYADEDYLGGESNDLSVRPADGPLQDGIQWHGLVWIDCFWGHFEKPGTIESPRFTDEQLRDYLQTCWQHQGGVTFNVGIYQDGTLAPQTVEQIKRIHASHQLSGI